MSKPKPNIELSNWRLRNAQLDLRLHNGAVMNWRDHDGAAQLLRAASASIKELIKPPEVQDHYDDYGYDSYGYGYGDNPGGTNSNEDTPKPAFVSRSNDVSDYRLEVRAISEALSDIFNVPTYDVIQYLKDNPYNSLSLSDLPVKIPTCVRPFANNSVQGQPVWSKALAPNPFFSQKVDIDETVVNDSSYYSAGTYEVYACKMKPLYAYPHKSDSATYSRTLLDSKAIIGDSGDPVLRKSLFTAIPAFEGDFTSVGPSFFNTSRGVLQDVPEGILYLKGGGVNYAFREGSQKYINQSAGYGLYSQYGAWGCLRKGAVVFWANTDKAWMKKRIGEDSLYVLDGDGSTASRIFVFPLSSLRSSYPEEGVRVGEYSAISPASSATSELSRTTYPKTNIDGLTVGRLHK